jgi:CelD/BcsL family acetyltransferase involved in cellulose biosynthesis
MRAEPAGAFTVDELGERGAFRALGEPWQALAARLDAAGPFLHPEWFAVYAADLARAPGALRLLIAHRRGELAGALPLFAEWRRIAGVPARVLRSLSDDHSQRFELLVEEQALPALWRHLARDPWWDVLELRDLPEASARARQLTALAGDDGFPTGEWPAMVSPYLPLSTVAALEESLPVKFQANLRRRARRLAEEEGPLTLERVTGGAELDGALDEGLELEACGWKGEAGTAIARNARLHTRYRALARAFARRGELSLAFLRAGDRRVAFHFAIESGGVYYLFKPGYDESLARFGPGHLLLWEVAKELTLRGACEIDLLGDDTPWKRVWTRCVRRHSWRYVFRPSAFGRALHAWKFAGLPRLRRALAARPEPPADDERAEGVA